MSPAPSRAEPDLVRLADEGFRMEVVGGHLVVRDVAYLDAHRRIRSGLVAVRLQLCGEVLVAPRGHMAWFGGGTPCDADGRPLDLLHRENRRLLAAGLEVDHVMCSRPDGGFADHHAMVRWFVDHVEAPARAVDPSVGARRGMGASRPVVSPFPFRYSDTASSRAGISALSARLERRSIGIVGLGGTGSYVLDLVAKTPVSRIHLYDADVFEQHSAFRAPGAAGLDEVAARRAKVDHWAAVYSRLHAGVVPHRCAIGPNNAAMLSQCDFVFVAVDAVAGRRAAVDWLERAGRPFVDVGMGLRVTEAGIAGTLRVTTSTDAMRAHVRERARIPFDGIDDDPYASNVQVADLNCLNAALAVVRWKRLCGFYADTEGEHWSAYLVDGNALLNDEHTLAAASAEGGGLGVDRDRRGMAE